MTKQNKAPPPQHDACMTREQDKAAVIPPGQFLPTLATLGATVLKQFITSLAKSAITLREGGDGARFDVPEKVESELPFTIPNTGIAAKLMVGMAVENWSDVL